jgi:hypothetical protein
MNIPMQHLYMRSAFLALALVVLALTLARAPA